MPGTEPRAENTNTGKTSLYSKTSVCGRVGGTKVQRMEVVIITITCENTVFTVRLRLILTRSGKNSGMRCR